jgi:hypothetical protein
MSDFCRAAWSIPGETKQHAAAAAPAGSDIRCANHKKFAPLAASGLQSRAVRFASPLIQVNEKRVAMGVWTVCRLKR